LLNLPLDESPPLTLSKTYFLVFLHLKSTLRSVLEAPIYRKRAKLWSAGARPLEAQAIETNSLRFFILRVVQLYPRASNSCLGTLFFLHFSSYGWFETHACLRQLHPNLQFFAECLKTYHKWFNMTIYDLNLTLNGPKSIICEVSSISTKECLDVMIQISFSLTNILNSISALDMQQR
jgi:hypothetical protein